MRSFNNSNRGGRRDFDNRGSDRPAMHNAICSKCGKACQVPFLPTGNRPIFCRDCFKEQGGAPLRSSGQSDRPMYDAICDKCGNRCRIPFQPRAGKPVFCSHCFEGNEKDARKSGPTIIETPKYRAEFDALNAKLDKILTLLATTPAVTQEPKTAEVTITEEKPVIKKKKATNKTTSTETKE